QDLGAVGSGGFELLDGGLEARRLGGVDDDRLAAGEDDRLGVRHPVGGGDQHFVAGVEEGREGVVNGLLAAVGDEDVGGLDGVAGVPGRLGGDGVPQLG